MEASDTLLNCLIVLILVTSAKAEVDCSKPPNSLEIRGCCNIPESRWDFLPQCKQQKKERHPSPCVMDCIFNATNVLDGYALNIDNLRSTLTQMIPNNKELVEAFMIGFQKCQPIIKKKLDELRTSPRGLAKLGTGMCPKTAAIYAMCAFKTVFISCPSEFWTATPACERFKEYANACETYMDGPGSKRRGRGARKKSGGDKSSLAGIDA